MGKLEHLYQKLPLFLQNFAIQYQGYRIAKERFNSQFHYFLNQYNENLKLKKDDLLEIQKEELSQALLNARNSPYWSEIFQKFSIHLDSDSVYEEIEKLPILTKDVVKGNFDSICIKKNKEKIIHQYTSGTTGSGMLCPQTLSMLNKQWAIWWRYRLINGIDFNTWCGWFGGKIVVPSNVQSPPYWRINKPGKQLMLSPLHLSKETAALYVAELSKRKIPWLHGYPSQLALFANYIKELNLPLWPELKIITIGAENLLDSQKDLLRDVFNVEVRQHYGLTEGVANISEYPDGRLHVDNDFCYVEFIPLEDNTEYCKIIGTNFSNHAFPLFRYDTGDIAKVKKLGGGEFEIISIEGRDEDYLTLSNGKRLGPFNLIMKEFRNVKEAQLVQKSLDSIHLRIVQSADFSNTDEQNIIYEIKSRLTTDVKFSIEYLEKIPRTRSGKLKAVIKL